jgi:putative redox protein
MKTKLNWVSKNHLEGETETGHVVIMDNGTIGVNTKGPTPKELLLQSLAGCTMIDVVNILEKQRKHVEKFWIDAEAVTAKESPKVFKKIHLTYNFIGDDLSKDCIKKAISLSKEKYCSIFAMLKNSVHVTYSFRIYSIIEFIDHVYEKIENEQSEIYV